MVVPEVRAPVLLYPAVCAFLREGISAKSHKPAPRSLRTSLWTRSIPLSHRSSPPPEGRAAGIPSTRSLPCAHGKLRSHSRRVSRVCVLIGGCALNAPRAHPTREIARVLETVLELTAPRSFRFSFSRVTGPGTPADRMTGAVPSSSRMSSSAPTRVEHLLLQRSPTTTHVQKALRRKSGVEFASLRDTSATFLHGRL